MLRPPSFLAISVALVVVGLVGLGFLFAPGGPSFLDARLELGGALVSGVVLSGAFLVAERRLVAEDREREERVAQRDREREERAAARQDRERRQLTLGMATNLKGQRLSGLDLSGLQLSGKDMNHAVFTETNLTGANLAYANLSWANLRGANLAGANLSGSRLSGATLTGANLSGATLSGATLRRTGTSGPLERLMLTGLLHLARPFLRATNPYWESDLKEYMEGSRLTDANLAGAQLEGAKWNPAYPPAWPKGFEPPGNAWNLDTDG